jgi:8-oxo-dGTP pyrophosphatase MutT (NUDIX family)
MAQQARYQAAVIQAGKLLLIQHHFFANDESYWGLPGGRQEAGETEFATVAREVREETGLIVQVEKLLLDEPYAGPGRYNDYRTYLCTPLSGTAQPGSEPEADSQSLYEISGVKWINLWDESEWGEDLRTNPVMGPLLRNIRDRLI